MSVRTHHPYFNTSNLKRQLQNKSVAVLGLGRSGISAARCLLQCGAKVFLSDIQPRHKIINELPPALRILKSEYGGHTNQILKCNLIVVSPGVAWKMPLLSEARRNGIPVWSELEMGYRLTNFKTIIGVTGTNGKTTTVSLIGDMCRRGGLKTLVAGNIGKPLCDYVNRSNSFDCAVLEVSSYQLEGIESFHSRVSIILNITSDHIHRHLSMSGYAKAKERIFLNQTKNDLTVLNADDPRCVSMSKRCIAGKGWFSSTHKLKQGVFFEKENNEICVRLDIADNPMRFTPPARLYGIHNVENSCAAISAALWMGVSTPAIRDSLKKFKGVVHRCEIARSFKGVTYINDSKSTNVDSTLKAIQSFSKPIWLILGGQDKGAPYSPLKHLIRERVNGIFLIGESAKKIYSELKDSADFYFSKTMKRAVLDASKVATHGQIVLLSPACASFDQFRNFEDRGNQFKELVQELK